MSPSYKTIRSQHFFWIRKLLHTGKYKKQVSQNKTKSFQKFDSCGESAHVNSKNHIIGHHLIIIYTYIISYKHIHVPTQSLCHLLTLSLTLSPSLSVFLFHTHCLSFFFTHTYQLFFFSPNISPQICTFLSLIIRQVHFTHKNIHKPRASNYHIYQPLRSGRIWHKVNF